MATTDVIREHIKIVEGVSGPKARIAGHRIRVQDVVMWHEKMGLSAKEIVEQWPTIALADVYAALAYYWDNREEIEAAIDGEREYVEATKRAQGPGLLPEKLRDLRRGQGSARVDEVDQ